MKRSSLAALATAILLTFAPHNFAADAKAELRDLVEKVKAKLQEGKKTEQDLTEELKSFDTLVAKYKGAKSEEAAEILLTKAIFFAEALENEEKAIQVLKQVRPDFPDTTASKKAEAALAAFAQQTDAARIRRSLTVGTLFPDFDEKDLNGKPLSTANFKGKVVLIDFWVTSCDLCVEKMPKLREAYQKYHGNAFEIIGISLDLEREKLAAFIKEKDLSWPQYFDGKGWQNKLAVKYGVNSIPATYLLNKDGRIIAKDLPAEALETEIANAMTAK